MFEKDLAAKFKRIFDVPKVSFAQPGESHEMNCLWVEIALAKCRVKDGRVVGRVEGNAFIYDSGERLPFAYMAKQIAKATPSDTKDLFFFDIEGNAKGLVNIVQRSFSFIYLFNSQYDPSLGTIESITIAEAET